MKFFIYIISLSVFAATPAIAADKTDGVSSSIAVERILCQPAMVAGPNADANYKPGVDVDGHPVASADLTAPSPIMPTTYTEVPLNIDLARKLNLSPEKEMEGTFGNLRVYQNGRILYNGQDITQQAYVVCGKDPASAPAAPSVSPVNSVTMPPPDQLPMPGTAAPSATTPIR